MGHLPSYPLTFFIFYRVKERAKLGLIIPLPLSGEFPHLPHGFIPALHTGLGPALLFLYFLFASHKSLTFNRESITELQKKSRKKITFLKKVFTILLDNSGRGAAPPL